MTAPSETTDTATSVPRVFGHVAEGFEPVREEFERNLSERDELGGAFCAWHQGTKVVDIWGGVADSTTARPGTRRRRRSSSRPARASSPSPCWSWSSADCSTWTPRWRGTGRSSASRARAPSPPARP
ncbi:hypothetical protein NKH77_38815 [Streptomyces sp. M19]